MHLPHVTWRQKAAIQNAVDEFRGLVDASGVRVIALDAVPDAPSVAALEGGLPLAARFRGKAPAVNGVTHAWLVGR